ncbi:hypothetical protein PHYBLDRAFT_146440 [Phycomyces blakesleeanus NRRL 1555(-)]|uniref:Uncharacterized protein n=1 Tax=Phycomyces blakesleeanus (strain ATCC 8743b / DSM 1359 / FGSC 10004 / NBRC 33097 / NRRL 1555) TaxID=763407 RepID=A0A162N915_PHYB8|nr:hypothetical protein PHYBLDRAFT_146440 [Phycomyces blakesleeanus NRRL 1555(-)]OAD72238.1 hypothetical protein PHYBLDRAFT_146440 [Phycomyces blakesleeanus NRRL 1555(-)]|eukprot:XP_018290278.1 hypothetical protein PHYBLDRAFT_146440 [Phycomyces blakesleeanus NRRL 1555(-)]
MHDHRIRTTDALLESHPHYGCVIRIASALRMRKLYLYLITLEKPLDYQMHYLKTINDYSFCDLLENKLFLSHMTTGYGTPHPQRPLFSHTSTTDTNMPRLHTHTLNISTSTTHTSTTHASTTHASTTHTSTTHTSTTHTSTTHTHISLIINS